MSYSLASGVILALCYLGYKWVMASEKQYSFNRFLLYFILIVSFSLPFLAKGLTFGEAAAVSDVASIELGELQGGEVIVEDGERDNIFLRVLLWVYFSGMAVTLLYSLAGGIQLFRIIRRGEKSKLGKYILVLSDDNSIAPFSWIRYIVMSRADYEDAGDYIVIHESRHLSLRHWCDMLVAQLTIIFQWYNPASWLIREEFRNVHEYQADEAVVLSGANAKEYQMLLIKKTVGKSFQTLANSLNHSKLKKRVTMMYKRKSTVRRRLGAVVLLPAMALGCVVINLPAVAGVLDETAGGKMIPVSESKVNEKSAIPEIKFMEAGTETTVEEQVVLSDDRKSEENRGQEAKAVSGETEKVSEPVAVIGENKENKRQELPAFVEESKAALEAKDDKKEEVSMAVEELAEYPGGQKALMNWLAYNTRYPQEAHKANIQGKVVVRFVVGADGKIGEAKVLRSVSPELDAEAVRVVKSMPAWIPGKNGGKAVASYYSIPIEFRLSPSEKAGDSTSAPNRNKTE